MGDRQREETGMKGVATNPAKKKQLTPMSQDANRETTNSTTEGRTASQMIADWSRRSVIRRLPAVYFGEYTQEPAMGNDFQRDQLLYALVSLFGCDIALRGTYEGVHRERLEVDTADLFSLCDTCGLNIDQGFLYVRTECTHTLIWDQSHSMGARLRMVAPYLERLQRAERPCHTVSAHGCCVHSLAEIANEEDDYDACEEVFTSHKAEDLATLGETDNLTVGQCMGIDHSHPCVMIGEDNHHYVMWSAGHSWGERVEVAKSEQSFFLRDKPLHGSAVNTTPD